MPNILKLFNDCVRQAPYEITFQITTMPTNVARVGVSILKIIFFYFDFSWEGGGNLPQNSYKPIRDL